VLCKIASWDCFGDAIASFIDWVKICPPNSPTVQFGTALSKSPPRFALLNCLGLSLLSLSIVMQSCVRNWVKTHPAGGGTRSVMGDAQMANERLREQK